MCDGLRSRVYAIARTRQIEMLLMRWRYRFDWYSHVRLGHQAERGVDGMGHCSTVLRGGPVSAGFDSVLAICSRTIKAAVVSSSGFAKRRNACSLADARGEDCRVQSAASRAAKPFQTRRDCSCGRGHVRARTLEFMDEWFSEQQLISFLLVQRN